MGSRKYVLSLLSASLGVATIGQGGPKARPGVQPFSPPLYQVSFERREPVQDVSGTGALDLPFQCTSGGTLFVNFIGTVPAGAGVKPPRFPPMLLTSISPSGHGRTFRLDQVPDLYISRPKYHFASDSGVIFLVRAARENKPVKRTFQWSDGSQGEYEDNAAPQHLYILSFTRDGEYQRTVEIEDAFTVLQVGLFPSGSFLAFGYDEEDHAPRLVMLKPDGTLLKSLSIPVGDAPKSMISAADAPRHPHAIVPTELVPAGHSIRMVVQNETAFPLLEVTEGGEIRAIRPQWPKGTQNKAIVPSDRDLYVIASLEAEKADFDGSIYKLNPENGAVLSRFELGESRQGLGVACVHDGKFLSIDFGDGMIIPLVGSAELSSTATR